MGAMFRSPFPYIIGAPAQRSPHLPFIRPPQKLSPSSWNGSKMSLLRPSQATQTAESSKEGAETSKARVTIKELCRGRVSHHILQRAEEIGYVIPTDIQEQALPTLLSGRDCILHAQTGSGKTLAYLLGIFATIDFHRSAVQALIVVPTRELGIQVTKVARLLAAKPSGCSLEEKSCTVMALLDGGTLRRHRSWLKAEPPEIVVATIGSLSQMLEKKTFKLEALQILVVDEVDFLFNSSKQVYSLRKLLTSYSAIHNRQTIFASASIPQHNHFLSECIQQKWTKRDVVHVHVHPVDPMPFRLCHRFVPCRKDAKLDLLLRLLKIDQPRSCIIFVAEQSEKSRKAGKPPTSTCMVEFLRTACDGMGIHLLDEEMNFNARAASLSDARQGGCLLVATDIASRGVDLPETTHIYNFDMPRTAIDYLHRAGRTGRRPFSDEKNIVTTLIAPEERKVWQGRLEKHFTKCSGLEDTDQVPSHAQKYFIRQGTSKKEAHKHSRYKNRNRATRLSVTARTVQAQ